MRRVVDIAVSVGAMVVLAPVLILIAASIKLTSAGPVLYWSNRVGQRNAIFRMPKFRTMKVDTPTVATHLLSQPERYLTRVGGFLRRYSLDELPQLFSILKGDITLIGPRPALDSQRDLIALRTENGIHHLVPGLTGWAQVNGRDTLSNERKVEFDGHYLRHRTALLDLKIIFLTLLKVIRGDGVTH